MGVAGAMLQELWRDVGSENRKSVNQANATGRRTHRDRSTQSTALCLIESQARAQRSWQTYKGSPSCICLCTGLRCPEHYHTSVLPVPQGRVVAQVFCLSISLNPMAYASALTATYGHGNASPTYLVAVHTIIPKQISDTLLLRLRLARTEHVRSRHVALDTEWACRCYLRCCRQHQS